METIKAQDLATIAGGNLPFWIRTTGYVTGIAGGFYQNQLNDSQNRLVALGAMAITLTGLGWRYAGTSLLALTGSYEFGAAMRSFMPPSRI